MKLTNIEVLLKNAKGIRHQIATRNGTINKVTSFGYQLVSAETADRIFNALASALKEREALMRLSSDLNETYYRLPLSERTILHLMSCKEYTLNEACEKLNRPYNEVRAAYRRAMREMSAGLSERGYDDFMVQMFVGECGILVNSN